MIDDLVLLAVRLAVGGSIASHGAQKAFGWFEGPGPDKAAGYFEGLGFKPGARFAQAASATEIGSGILIALGLGGPLGPAGLLSTMIVAAQSVHAKNGYFQQKGGVELNVLYAASALALAARGFGALSLDRALGLHDRLHHPVLETLALAGGVLSAWAILGQRDAGPPEGTLATPTISGARSNGSAEPARS
ncbi:MAG TPA: DoxX family protein [Candidatus Sulfotelmatobacter sp.]|nr:DoxX family protein [Candidatus Sulfotelmatobacter sp.]